MDVAHWSAELRASPRARKESRRRSLSNLTRMGHCAPTVVRTVLDEMGAEDASLVRLAGGLPGGVANTGSECGAVTGAVLLLGLHHGSRKAGSLPIVVEEGRAYCAAFRGCHGSLLCREILGDRRVPLPCVKAVRTAPELLADAVGRGGGASPAPEREAHRRVCEHLDQAGFHCAHAVFLRLGADIPLTPELLAATQGFLGGTLLLGLTCSALAAGVMAIALGAGGVETRRSRVARMLLTMIAGGDGLRDELNEFNRSLNRGNALARWFADAFGSTQCREITRCSFSSAADVDRYVASRQVEACREIAAQVAAQAARALAEARAHG